MRRYIIFLAIVALCFDAFAAAVAASGDDMDVIELDKAELNGLILSLRKIEQLGFDGELSLRVFRANKQIIYSFKEFDSVGDDDADVRGNASGGLALEFTYTPVNGELNYNHVR